MGRHVAKMKTDSQNAREGSRKAPKINATMHYMRGRGGVLCDYGCLTAQKSVNFEFHEKYTRICYLLLESEHFNIFELVPFIVGMKHDAFVATKMKTHRAPWSKTVPRQIA